MSGSETTMMEIKQGDVIGSNWGTTLREVVRKDFFEEVIYKPIRATGLTGVRCVIGWWKSGPGRRARTAPLGWARACGTQEFAAWSGLIGDRQR